MLMVNSAIKEVEMMSGKNEKPWGLLRVGFSWEGRDTIVAKAIATKGLSVEKSQSKVLGPTFAHIDYTKVPRKIGVYEARRTR
jgi:hypothetical protein